MLPEIFFLNLLKTTVGLTTAHFTHKEPQCVNAVTFSVSNRSMVRVTFLPHSHPTHYSLNTTMLSVPQSSLQVPATKGTGKPLFLNLMEL